MGERCGPRCRVAQLPHVSAWADLLVEAGYHVELAGRPAPGWPELELSVPSHRLPAARPPPLRGFPMSRALRRVATTSLDPSTPTTSPSTAGWPRGRSCGRSSARPGARTSWLRRGQPAPVEAGNRESSLVFVDSAHLAREAQAMAGGEARWRSCAGGSTLRPSPPATGGGAGGARAPRGWPARGEHPRAQGGLQPGAPPGGVRARQGCAPGRAPAAQAPLDATPASVARRSSGSGSATRSPCSGTSWPSGCLTSTGPPTSSCRLRPATARRARSGRRSHAAGPWWSRTCRGLATSSSAAAGHSSCQLDAGAIAAAIERVLDDAGLAARLADRGELAAAELDPAACGARVDALYRSVVEAA